VPRNHGGDNTLENLALACARCNYDKGKRHDHRARGTPRLEHVIRQLQRKRKNRWRSSSRGWCPKPEERDKA
jgi:5-methylcytosine-specific restriction endonuclease McrA